MTDPPATLEGWDIDFSPDGPNRGQRWEYFRDSFSKSGYTLYIVSPQQPAEICPPDDYSLGTLVEFNLLYQSVAFNSPQLIEPRVWKSQKDGKVYWIKVIHKGPNLNDCVEGQILENLESLPIVPLHEMLCFQEWWFSVAEHHVPASEVFLHPCPIREGVKFGRQLLQDVAVENILTTSDHTFLLMDFGQSCITDGVTPTTSVYGGRDNIAPEMEKTRRGEPYDPFAADIFASGLLLISFLHPLYEFTDQLFPLFGKMVEKVPKSRILARDALDEYNRIMAQIPEDRLGELRRFHIRRYVTPPSFDQDVAISLMKWCQEN